MEKYEVHVAENQFLIEGLPPDVATIVSLGDLLPAQSLELRNLAAHLTDLTFAKSCLDLINTESDDANKALWRTAIIYYFKCFAKSNRRKPLNIEYLPTGLPREIHGFYKSLRNKNLVHDENGWLQTWAGVAVAASGKGYNVEKIVYATTESVTLQQEDYGNMYLLVEHAISWVNSECERLCNEMTAELEKLERETLLNQPNITYQPPMANEVHLSRSV